MILEDFRNVPYYVRAKDIHSASIYPKEVRTGEVRRCFFTLIPYSVTEMKSAIILTDQDGDEIGYCKDTLSNRQKLEIIFSNGPGETT